MPVISIAAGLNRKGNKAVYDADFDTAVGCFTRAVLYEPENTAFLMDMIYALNQCSDFAEALELCYALLGKQSFDGDLSALYFLTAEAFGGLGCVESCAQMLKMSLKCNPDGRSSADARSFLEDLQSKYDLEKVKASGNETSYGLMNAFSEPPVLNYETAKCLNDISSAVTQRDFAFVKSRLEEEFRAGNVTVTLLGCGLSLAEETSDPIYLRHCVELFDAVEDYTMHELTALAAGISSLQDADMAKSVYQALYRSERAEKSIAFAFAVACARKGELAHAAELAKALANKNGNIGPAQYLLEELEKGQVEHSYLYRIEGAPAERIADALRERTRDVRLRAEGISMLRNIEFRSALELLGYLDPGDPLTNLLLRRLAMDREAAVVLRAEAAMLLVEHQEKVYFNTGTDVVEFTGELYDMLQRLMQEEPQDSEPEENGNETD